MHKASASIFVCAALLGVALLVPRHAVAAWPDDPLVNVPLCTVTGDQYGGTSVSDGAGGAIVTWEDQRGGPGIYDIYAQRVSADGTVLWTTDGVALCTATGTQTAATITSDGAGGAIVSWVDYRSGESSSSARIYAQRISAAGAVQWTANGVALCTATGLQGSPVITSDGAGGAIVIWEDYRGGGNPGLYAQRISAAGTVQWTPDGVALCTATGGQYRIPKIVSDGAGGAIVTWSDYRSGTNFDIYAQRISAAGTVQWTADGMALGTATSDHQAPAIASDDAGGAIVTWMGYRSGLNHIYTQRISAVGTVQWTVNGIALCTAPRSQDYPTIVADGAGGAIVSWRDYRSSPTDGNIYAQRISAGGTVQWAADGVALCTATGDQYHPTIVSDGASGAIVSWGDPRSGNYDIYTQRISAAGTTQWTVNGVALCTAAGDQYEPTSTSDGTGGAIITWPDPRSGSSDIYAQRIGGDGAFIGPEPTILSVRDIPADQGGKVRIKWAASYRDKLPTLEVSIYGIWRQVEEFTALKAIAAGAKLDASTDGSAEAQPRTFKTTVNGAGTLYWEGVGTVAARGYPTYTFTAFTFQDSTAAGNPYSVFMVDAHPQWPEYWSSAPDSGYSVDNLAPAQPAPFAALYGPSAGVALHWGTNTERDLREYRLYRGTSPSFTPGPSNLVVAQLDTGFYDASGSLGFAYKLSAIDIHGNESRFALVTPDGATGALASLLSAEVDGTVVRLRWLAAANPGLSATVYRRTAETNWTTLGQVSADGTGIMAWNDAQVSRGQNYGYRLGIWDGASETFLGETWIDVPTLTLTFALEGVRPNPSRGEALTVSFSLPSDRPARLELFDLGGRRLVAREVGSLGAGQHRLDVGAGATLRAGMYVLRLTQGQQSRSLKAVVVR